MGFKEVRSELDSNLSTTTCNLAPESLAIWLNRATMTSRPQPIPRFESVHEERVSLVPHATRLPISARIDFSSTAGRATAPAGRANSFGCGLPCAGSAGSRGAARCATVGIALRARAKNTNAIEVPKCSRRFIPLIMLISSPIDVALSEFGILAQLGLQAARVQRQ